MLFRSGPGTISEAFISGLPLILYSKMPGQEDGNVGYVINQGAGIWAPHPDQMVESLQYWLSHPDELKIVANRSKHLAKPNASREIARELVKQVHISMGNRD